MEWHAIVAVCNGFGIGKGAKIPWHVPSDLKRFKTLTSGHVVLMGRKTYFSIPETRRPLSNRFNVVITKHPSRYRDVPGAVKFVKPDDVETFLATVSATKCFVIGGVYVYIDFLGRCETVHLTHVKEDHACDLHFPIHLLAGTHELVAYQNQDARVSFLTYRRKRGLVHADNVYASLLEDVRLNGDKKPDRTGTGTYSVFARQLRFDISTTVPLLTTKRVPWKMVIEELLWFLKGNTDATALRERGVNIWNANTSREFLDARGLSHYREGDLGPMYGWQWRHSGAEYRGCDHPYEGVGKDQLTEALETLKTDPDSRRIVMTTYNPSDLDKSCLHPCHGLVVQFYVDANEKLSCHMYQRSVDTFLGLTWNVFGYAVLTRLLAKKAGLETKELIISTGDTHLYADHVDQAVLQSTRRPFPLPILEIDDSVVEKSWEELSVEDFRIHGYFHHPAIRARMSV